MLNYLVSCAYIISVNTFYPASRQIVLYQIFIIRRRLLTKGMFVSNQYKNIFSQLFDDRWPKGPEKNGNVEFVDDSSCGYRIYANFQKVQPHDLFIFLSRRLLCRKTVRKFAPRLSQILFIV